MAATHAFVRSLFDRGKGWPPLLLQSGTQHCVLGIILAETLKWTLLVDARCTESYPFRLTSAGTMDQAAYARHLSIVL